jgi:hypothetical protein
MNHFWCHVYGTVPWYQYCQYKPFDVCKRTFMCTPPYIKNTAINQLTRSYLTKCELSKNSTVSTLNTLVAACNSTGYIQCSTYLLLQNSLPGIVHICTWYHSESMYAMPVILGMPVCPPYACRSYTSNQFPQAGSHIAYFTGFTFLVLLAREALAPTSVLACFFSLVLIQL